MSDGEHLSVLGSIERNGYLYIYVNSSNIYKVDLRNNDISVIHLEWKFENCFWTDSFMVDGIIVIQIGASNFMVTIDSNDKLDRIFWGDNLEKWELCNIEYYNKEYYILYKDKTGSFHSSRYNVRGGEYYGMI